MKKKKILIVAIILIFLILLGLSCYLYIKDRDEKISLIKDEVNIEYGNNYNPNIEELINFEEFNYINKNEIEMSSNITNIDGKEYPAVSEYKVEVKYKDKVLVQKVKVRDTTAPELSIKEKIEIQKGTELTNYDFRNFISLQDLSELKEYHIDFSSVDPNVIGSYSAKISVEDIYENKAEREFIIEICELERDIEETDNSQTNINNSAQKTNVNISSNVNKAETTTSKNSTPTSENSNKNNESSQTINTVTTPTDEQVQVNEQPTRCTTNNNHAMSVGNCGQWFNSKNEAITYYNNKISYWGNLWENFEIDDSTYYSNCPSGYEIWSCAYCSKWTINMYYR